MQTFIGTKIVVALAMTRLAYNEYRGWDLPANEDGADEGYLVEYTDGGKPNHPNHTGYISWSPKQQFETAYFPVANAEGLAPHQVRVIGEKAQLDVKLAKLMAFQESPIYSTVDSDEQSRLSMQRDAMAAYSQVLGLRIAAFGGEA